MQPTPNPLDFNRLLITTLQNMDWRPIFLIFLCVFLVFLIKFIPALFYLRKLRRSGIVEIDLMSGEDFERYLQQLFTKLGYSVQHIGNSHGDYGGDLIITKDSTRTLVQAKRYTGKVGIAAVQEVVAGKNKYSCQKTMVVTNSSFTRQAWELARANYVTLWGRKRLVEAILQSQ